MHGKAIQQVLGLLLILFSLTMLPPVFVSAWYHDGSGPAFVSGFLVTLVTGIVIWAPARHARRELRSRDGFLVVAGFWTLLGLFGAAPLVFVVHPKLTLTDAVFEAVSGLTTTGATVIVGLDSLDRLADILQTLDPAPAAVTFTERPYSFERRDGVHQVRVAMPFAGKGEVGLFKKGDELVVEVGVFRRHIGLPTTLAALEPVRATFDDRTLVVELGERR